MTAGQEWARAIAARDHDAIRAVLSPEIDFMALTPRKSWEASDPEAVLEIVLDTWFTEQDRIDSHDAADGDPVEDTDQVSYRFAITNEDGPHTVEQQAYYRTEGDRISYLRVMCSGYRPQE